MAHDKVRPQQYEFDPRWEVQPEAHQSEDPGGDPGAVTVALVILSVSVILLGVAVWTTSPSF